MNGIASEVFSLGPVKAQELRLLQKKRENCETKQKMCSNNSSIAENNCTKGMDETFSEDWALICRKFILPPMTEKNTKTLVVFIY